MNDYGKTLGLATLLPATSAAGIFFANAHPLILIGFFIIGVVGLINLAAYISRYLINKK